MSSWASEHADTISVFDSLDRPAEPLTTAEVAAELDCPRETARERLTELVDSGELRTKEVGANARVWWRPARSDGSSDVLEKNVRRRDALFDNIQDIANVGGWEYDVRTDEGWWSEEVSRIHGVPPDHTLDPEESLEFYHPEDRPRVEAALENALEEGEPYDLEVRFIDADDRLRWIRTRGQPQHEDGEVVRIRGTFQDITERKAHEHESERLHALLTNVERLGDLGAWEFDIRTREAYWTEGTRRLHEVDDAFEPTVEDGIEFFHPDDRDTISRLIRESIRTGEPYSAELRLITANDNERWVYTEGEVLERDGKPQVVRGYIQDITERKEREAEFEQLVEEYEAIFENTTDQLTLIDVEWSDGDPVFRYVRTNPENVARTGLEPETFEGKTPIEAVGPEIGRELRENYRRCIEAGETIEYEEEHDLPNPVISETKLTPVMEDGVCKRIVASSRDVTEQKEYERTLEQYRALTRTASDVIVTIDTEGVIRSINPAMSEMFGYDPDHLHGEPVTSLLSAADGPALWRRLDGEDPEFDRDYVEFVGVCDDGSEIPIEISFSRYEHDDEQYFTGIIRDISDRKERDQLRRLDQLNTVIRTISKAVVQARTQDEIIEPIYEALLDVIHHQFVVIGEFSPSLDQFEPWRGSDHAEDYLRDFMEAFDQPLNKSLGAAAARTSEVQVYQTLGEHPFDSVRTLVEEYGVRSVAAVPLVYEDTVLGVIGLYADRPRAFEEPIRDGLSELGEIVGYALSALERKEVLDRVVEMEFRSEDLTRPFLEMEPEMLRLEFDSAVPRSDGTRLEYWTVEGTEASTYTCMAEQFPNVLDTRLLSTVGDTSRFEIVTSPDSIASIVGDFDGEIQTVTFRDETAIVKVEFPERAQTEAVVRRLRELYPDIELNGRQRVLTPTYLRAVLEGQLTDRQRTALRTAYFAGYFDQPRLSTGTELAERLGISKQTFHQHLRKAEKAVFREFFDPSE